MQLMERRGYGEEYINRYKMMTRFVYFLEWSFSVFFHSWKPRMRLNKYMQNVCV